MNHRDDIEYNNKSQIKLLYKFSIKICSTFWKSINEFYNFDLHLPKLKLSKSHVKQSTFKIQLKNIPAAKISSDHLSLVPTAYLTAT
jgi:hypothetical protein